MAGPPRVVHCQPDAQKSGGGVSVEPGYEPTRCSTRERTLQAHGRPHGASRFHRDPLDSWPVGPALGIGQDDVSLVGRKNRPAAETYLRKDAAILRQPKYSGARVDFKRAGLLTHDACSARPTVTARLRRETPSIGPRSQAAGHEIQEQPAN